MDDVVRPPSLPLFLFGTLMDVDVLAHVVSRPVDPAELDDALLWGFRRHAARNAPYPVLREHPDRHVRGCLFQPRSRDERQRIDHFEADEYRPAVLRVQHGTQMRPAVCYVEMDEVFDVSDADWSLHHFQWREKPRYLRACARWMADYACA